MPAKRRVLGTLVEAMRIVGLLLIVLGILGLPQMSFLTGHMAARFGAISGVVLMIMGIVCLAGVQLFLRFFDEYMSRN